MSTISARVIVGGTEGEGNKGILRGRRCRRIVQSKLDTLGTPIPFNRVKSERLR